MGSKRYTYKITIQPSRQHTCKVPSKKESFYYDYGHTKNIELGIYKRSHAVITADMTVKNDASTLLIANLLFKDALRKILIVHLLISNVNLDADKITVEIYDNNLKKATAENKNPISSHTYQNKFDPIVCSMIQGELNHGIIEKWSKEEIENMVNVKKSDVDRRETALILFLNSKSKRYESERFLFLWMAFNGMYGYLRKFIAEEIGNNNFSSQEAEQIKNLQEFLGFERGNLRRSDSGKVADKIKSIVREEYNATTNELTEEKLKTGAYKGFSQKIEKVIVDYSKTLPDNEKTKDYKVELSTLTGYMYLLTQFTYYFRCDYFHASKPIPLYMFVKDPDLIYFKAMNNLLEEFIENNLHEWFSDSKKEEFKSFATNKMSSYRE